MIFLWGPIARSFPLVPGDQSVHLHGCLELLGSAVGGYVYKTWRFHEISSMRWTSNTGFETGETHVWNKQQTQEVMNKSWQKPWPLNFSALPHVWEINSMPKVRFTKQLKFASYFHVWEGWVVFFNRYSILDFTCTSPKARIILCLVPMFSSRHLGKTPILCQWDPHCWNSRG